MGDLLGKIVRDKYTGLIGTATLYTKSICGLEQYLVEPNKVQGDAALFEVGRLEEVGFIEKENFVG